MSEEARLKSSLLVAAEIRRCDGLMLSAVVVHRGDDERGLILIKQYVHGNGARLFSQSRNHEGEFYWAQPLGDEWLADSRADEYIARQRKFDEDLWVIEVDDPRNQYSPGAV